MTTVLNFAVKERENKLLFCTHLFRTQIVRLGSYLSFSVALFFVRLYTYAGMFQCILHGVVYATHASF